MEKNTCLFLVFLIMIAVFIVNFEKDSIMKIKSPVGWIAFVLVIIGGLNWGLVGFFHFNLVDAIFGMGSVISRIIYVIVGLAAVYSIFMGAKCLKE